MTDIRFTQLFNCIKLNAKTITRGTFNEKKNKWNKLADGKDVDGRLFPDWQTDEANRNYSPTDDCAPVLGAIIESPLVFFDFDNREHYEQVLSLLTQEELDNCYNARGIDADGNTTGGHLGFRMDEPLVRKTLKVEDNYILQDGHYNDAALKLFTHKADSIDIQFGGGQLIFLASSGNMTKQLISCPNMIHNFIAVPKVLIYFIQSLLYQKGIKPMGEMIPSNFENRTFYHNKVSSFLSSTKHQEEVEFYTDFMPLEYQKKLSPKPHPDKLEDIGEAAHEFLLLCSTKLGNDPSVDAQMYEQAMYKINQTCRPSKTPTDLKAQIIDRMITGKATKDGAVIWQWNEEWNKISLSFSNRQTDDAYTVFLNAENSLTPYLMVNNTKAEHSFLNMRQLREIYSSFTGNKPANIQEKALSINLVRDMTLPYGLSDNNQIFNTYRRSKAMEIVAKPSLGDEYADPIDFIKYTQNLIPDHDIWEWLMRFWYTKLLNGKFSSVIIYFDGASGAGKSIFFKMMAITMGWKEFNPGSLHVMKEDMANDMFDTYMSEADVVVIEEISDWGNQKLAMKKANDCKTASSSEEYTQRLPGGATPRIKHRVTFGFTSNEPIALFKELNQRRLAIVYSPNSMTDVWTEKEVGELTTKWFDDRPVETSCEIAAWMTKNLQPLSEYEYRNVPKVIQESKAFKDYFEMTAKKDKQLMKALRDAHKDLNPLLEILNISSVAELHHSARMRGTKPINGQIAITVRTDGELSAVVDNSVEALAMKQNIELHGIFSQLTRAKVIHRLPSQNKYVVYVKGEVVEPLDMPMVSPEM